MLGVIKSIVEVTENQAGYGGMDGYKVTTDSHIVSMLIGNFQDCCESWGYFASDDDLNRFVGAELREINLTDTALNVKKVEENVSCVEAGGIQFVDFTTNVGTFQLAVYNAHNGYYGHSVRITFDDDVMLDDVL